MQQEADVVQDLDGNAVAGAAVQVLVKATGELAKLFADDETTEIANPVYTDANGRYAWKAANGKYKSNVTIGGRVFVGKVDITLFDPGDLILGDNSLVPTPSYDDVPRLSEYPQLNAQAQAIANRFAYLDSVGGAGRIGFQAVGTGSIGRTIDSKLNETVSVNDFAGLGQERVNAAVSDRAERGAIVNQQEYSGTAAIDPGEGGSIVLDGQGLSSTIRKAAGSAAGPVHAFVGRTKLMLSKLALKMDPDPAAVNSANLFRWDHDQVEMHGVTADGGVVLDGAGARNTQNNIAIVPNGEIRKGLKFFNSTFRRFFWGFLKSNTTVSTEQDITVAFSDFDEMGSTYLLFNSPAPGSKIENVQILGCKLGSVLSKQPLVGGAPGYPHRGSFAGHVEYSRLIGNHATGYGGELFRAEEAAKASIWLGNTAKLDGKDGIEIIPNNAGGAIFTPTLFAVGDNVLENVGLNSAPTLGWGIGLHVYTSVSGLADAECIGESTVHDNISKGWGQGLQVHQGAQRNLIHHNILAASAAGMKTWAPSLGMQDNMVSDCPVALDFQKGGVLGRVHFRSASGVPTAQAVTTADGVGATTGWTWETARVTLPTGDTEHELVKMGIAIDAEVVISVAHAAGTYSLERGRLSYDGTSFVYYRNTRKSAGNVGLSSAVPFGIKNGNLAIRISNTSGSAAAGVRISVALDGLHIWS